MNELIERVARWLHGFAETWGAAESDWDHCDQGEYRYQAGLLLAEMRSES